MLLVSYNLDKPVLIILADGAVNTASSSTGVVGIIKAVVANEEMQAIGQTILDSVPAMMSTLEALTDVHPFLKGA